MYVDGWVDELFSTDVRQETADSGGPPNLTAPQDSLQERPPLLSPDSVANCCHRQADYTVSNGSGESPRMLLKKRRLHAFTVKNIAGGAKIRCCGQSEGVIHVVGVFTHSVVSV